MNNCSLDFWNIVAEPADPMELDVGDVINLEYGDLRAVKIICETWTDGNGFPQIRIRDPQPGESFEPPTITIIATGEME